MRSRRRRARPVPALRRDQRIPPPETLLRKREGGPTRSALSNLCWPAGLARGCGLGLDRQHAHGPATAPPAELHLAVNQSEQGVITAAADSDAGVEVRAVLAHDDLASAHKL